MGEVNRVFKVDGKPFFSLGGQSRNSSGYNAAEAETAFQAVKLLHGNTLEIPVYWGQIEPREGEFDFTSVADLLDGARRYDLRLVLLWFGTWKNGNMQYTPEWVKRDHERFQRVINPGGVDLWVLSSHCRETFEADAKAFTALCRYLKENDTDGRVIALQVENEPGILGSDRDYGPLGEAAYNSPVPSELVSAMQSKGSGWVYDMWQAAGGASSGTWEELFGHAGGEIMTAWSIATYIDGVAAAGQAVLDIPMYINVWLGEQGWVIPGDTYPSGGAVTRVLDIYRWFTPHIALIAPDIYIADSRGYEAICAGYARDDNPLFVPESAPAGSNAWNMFRAIADYDAVGYHIFGVEHVMGEDGNVSPETQELVDSFRCVSAAIPLLLKYQGTDRVHALIQEENLWSQRLDLGRYIALAQFGDGAPRWGAKDWRHRSERPAPVEGARRAPRARGLVFQVSDYEFYVVGGNYRLFFRPRVEPRKAVDSAIITPFLNTHMTHYVSVDEGHFDENGEYVVDRRRNGDETSHGVWVEPDTGVVRIVLCE